MIGTVASSVPCMIRSGAVTRWMRVSEANQSFNSRRTGRKGNAAAATSAIDVWGAEDESAERMLGSQRDRNAGAERIAPCDHAEVP